MGIPPIYPSTSKQRKVAIPPPFPNTSGTSAYSAPLHPASSHTPNSRHRLFFLLKKTCTSPNQENCAKASDVSPVKAKLHVSGKSSLFEIHSI